MHRPNTLAHRWRIYALWGWRRRPAVPRRGRCRRRAIRARRHDPIAPAEATRPG